jgi:protein-L-isoaspartate(D-aspartate) O-methyltransferase
MNVECARQKMIDQQVRAWDVYDPAVQEVLARIPREQFVPNGFESLAFADIEIPIGHGESMMTPGLEGRILQSLDLDGIERVLEVGTGTGFLTACLARLANSVVSVDIYDEFLKQAGQNLVDTGVGNVELQAMDAIAGLPDGSFDAIAVTGSIHEFDPRFVEALNIGGRLFVIVGNAPTMEARVVERTGESDWHSETVFETQVRPLVHGALPPQFSF